MTAPNDGRHAWEAAAEPYVDRDCPDVGGPLASARLLRVPAGVASVMR